MKRLIYFVIIIPLLFTCKKDSLKFCEGVSPEGKEMNCGLKFSSGDLTILITPKKPFGVDTITINVYKIKGHIEKKQKTLPLKVKAENKTASTNISLYEEGRYIIKVKGEEDKEIATGIVEIIDAY